MQVHLLPLDRPGEARRLTDLPRGVDAFAWSPDGSRARGPLVVAGRRPRRRTTARGGACPTRARQAAAERLLVLRPPQLPAQRRRRDRRSTRRQLWIVDVATRRGAAPDRTCPAGVGWIGLVAGRPTDRGRRPAGPAIATSSRSSRILAVDVATGGMTTLAEHPRGLLSTARSGSTTDARSRLIGGRPAARLLPIGHLGLPGRRLRRAPAVGTLRAPRHHARLGDEQRRRGRRGGRLHAARRGRAARVPRAPKRGLDGAVATRRPADGRLERLTDDRHFLSAFDVVDRGADGVDVAAIRSTPTEIARGATSAIGACAAAPAAPGHVTFEPVSTLNAALLVTRSSCGRPIERCGRPSTGARSRAG